MPFNIGIDFQKYNLFDGWYFKCIDFKSEVNPVWIESFFMLHNIKKQKQNL